MIRKNPCYDTLTPAGQIINKVVIQDQVPKEATNVTWEQKPETPEEAYRRGWADAINWYEEQQKWSKN